MSMTGRCTKFGYCGKADSKEIVLINGNPDPRCLECGANLDVQDSRSRKVLWKIAVAGIASVIIGVLVWGNWPRSLTAPAITSNLSTSGSESQSFQYQIGATNDPTSYDATGLPQGLSMNNATGLISGIPTVAGTFPVTISAMNTTGMGSAILGIVITSQPRSDAPSPSRTQAGDTSSTSPVAALPPVPAASRPAVPSLEAKQSLQQGMTYVSLARQNPSNAYENYANAILEFSRAIDLYPCNATAYANRGVAYMLQKKFNNALTDMNKAVECDSQSEMAYYNLAALHAQQSRFDLAVDNLDKALALGFDNYDALRSDPDLQNIRQKRDFRKVLEKHKIFLK